MEKQTTSELIEEGKSLLELLPDPNMKLLGVGNSVYAESNVESSVAGSSRKPLIEFAMCEIDDCTSIEDILGIHDPNKLNDRDFLKENLQNEGDFKDYLQYLGNRHSQFFADAPEIIRKLIAELENEKLANSENFNAIDYIVFDRVSKDILDNNPSATIIALYEDIEDLNFTLIVVIPDDPQIGCIDGQPFFIRGELDNKHYRVAYATPEDWKKINSGEIKFPTWIKRKHIKLLV